ncbi:P-II family nitrogen regulator [Acaryochloris sp. IP29b_bin.148]|uniref:P-II family nitrogen regulator n=1 Tax=Acaryochloris sp. IP29b_bin.148 TaxID=2969218 RepID=UPI0026260DF6|nr:P-II family nitrogen regulator [Acaryochloris sp. IP29b_bin.148]
MRTITAVIRPHQWDEVKTALVRMGIVDITLSDVKGFGRQKGLLQQYRGSDAQIRFQRKLKVEVKVDPGMVAPVLEKITLAARTGQVGDGKIFVSPLDKVVQIRTGEERVELP